MNTVDQVETFMLKHGEAIVDTMGAEVDRIERNLKVSYQLNSSAVQPQNKLSTLLLNQVHLVLFLHKSVTGFRR